METEVVANPSWLQNWDLDIIVPVVAMAWLLIWGLRLLQTVLMSEAKTDGAEATLFSKALTEKTDAGGAPSFSRISGAIGAISLAAFFTGLGFWILFTLSFAPDKIAAHISGLQKYLLAGAALFAPYAVNQLRAIFK